MAIVWGGFSGHMRVGLDIRTGTINSGTTTTSIFVDVYVQIDSTWNFADNQHVQLVGSGANLGWDFFNNLGANQQLLIGTFTMPNQPLSYSGGPTYGWTATLSGHYQGASPSVTRNYSLPARPASTPGAPGLSITNVTSTAAKLNITAAASNGSTIDLYETQIATNSGFTTGLQTKTGGTQTVTGLAAATTYWARTRAHNGQGYGPYSTVRSFTTGATVPGTPTALASSNVGQTTATLNWTAPSSGGSSVDDYELQLASNTGFTSDVQTITVDPGPPENLTGLTPGRIYYARVRARNAVGFGPYTAAINFTTLAGTPTILTPTAGSVQTNGYASVLLSAQGIASGRTITVEISQSSTFASGVTTLTSSPSGPSANNQYLLQNTASYLKTGTWYARAKVTNNSTGYVTPWSTTVQFSQSHTPAASVQTPTGGQTYGYVASPTFYWQFSDASSVDAQTAYQLVIEDNATGTVIYDSAKVTSSAKQQSVALSTAYKNVQLRWRVRVYDRGDTVSAWTGYGLFVLADTPIVTIVTPTDTIPVDNGAPTFSWSVSIPSGGTQKSATVDVRLQSTNELIWTSTVQGTIMSVKPQTVILRNSEDYYLSISVTDTENLTGNAVLNFTTLYDAPDSIGYNIDAIDVDTLGYVAVNWADADPDDLFAEWKVYRRIGSGEWTLLAEIPDQNVRDYRDYLVNAGETYSYSVTQVATRSGELLESSVGFYLDEDLLEQAEARVFSIDLSYYWIINPENEDQSVRLLNVTDNSSTLEFEQESYNIIGRGRHVDYGDELGYTGELTCQVRIPERPSSFKKKIEELRRSKATYYLRTPFGQLIMVALGSPGWTPLAGVGTSEMGDLSIPYEEVK
jgi:hypothetical protein